MDRLTQMNVFVSVVQHASFTEAASALEMAKSTVSRHVSALEDRLGARLLNRSTRTIATTDVGRAYFERCLQIIADAEEADLAVVDLSSAPVGTLRVSASPAFASRYLMAPTAAYLARHPKVEVELLLDDRLVNLIDEGVDVAVRISHPTSSDLVARRLGYSYSLVCASPAYLARHGRPETPADLVHHECINRTERRFSAWTFLGPDGPIEVPTRGRFASNHGDALLEALTADIGLGLVPDFMVRAQVESGALVPLLLDWLAPPRAVSVVFPHRRLLAPKVRLYVDALVDAFAPSQPWQVAGCETGILP